MNLTTLFYVTAIKIGTDFASQPDYIQEKLLESLRSFREAVDATWEVEKEALLTFSFVYEDLSKSRSVRANIQRCAAVDCGETSRRGQPAVPDEIWVLTQIP